MKRKLISMATKIIGPLANFTSKIQQARCRQAGVGRLIHPQAPRGATVSIVAQALRNGIITVTRASFVNNRSAGIMRSLRCVLSTCWRNISLCLLVCLSVCLSVRQFTLRLSVCLLVCLFVCRAVGLSICLSVHPSVHGPSWSIGLYFISPKYPGYDFCGNF